MTDRTPSVITLRCVLFASVVILHGRSLWSDEFDVDVYERARKHSISPDEYTLSATELSTRSNGIKNGNTVSYTRKHERKKLTLTVVDSSYDQSRVGYSVTAIKTESAYASAQRFPGKPDYFLVDQVTNSDEDAEQSFSSVLPIFAPYSIDGTDILKILRDDQTQISDAQELVVDGRRQLQLAWSGNLPFGQPRSELSTKSPMSTLFPKRSKNESYSLLKRHGRRNSSTRFSLIPRPLAMTSLILPASDTRILPAHKVSDCGSIWSASR